MTAIPYQGVCVSDLRISKSAHGHVVVGPDGRRPCIQLSASDRSEDCTPLPFGTFRDTLTGAVKIPVGIGVPSLWNFASDLDERVMLELERLALIPAGHVYHPLCHMLGAAHPPCIRCNVFTYTRFFRTITDPGCSGFRRECAGASAGSAAVVQAEIGSVWTFKPTLDYPGMVGVTLYATDVLLTSVRSPGAQVPQSRQPAQPAQPNPAEGGDWSDIAA